MNTDGLVSTNEDCPLMDWKMCEDSKCEQESMESWFSIDGNTISLDTSKGIENQSKFLAAISSGNAVGSHPF